MLAQEKLAKKFKRILEWLKSRETVKTVKEQAKKYRINLSAEYAMDKKFVKLKKFLKLLLKKELLMERNTYFMVKLIKILRKKQEI